MTGIFKGKFVEDKTIQKQKLSDDIKLSSFENDEEFVTKNYVEDVLTDYMKKEDIIPVGKYTTLEDITVPINLDEMEYDVRFTTNASGTVTMGELLKGEDGMEYSIRIYNKSNSDFTILLPEDSIHQSNEESITIYPNKIGEILITCIFDKYIIKLFSPKPDLILPEYFLYSVSSNKIFHSFDGISFIESSGDIGGGCCKLIYDGKRFIGANNNGHVIYSKDGKDFTAEKKGIGYINDLASNGHTYVAVGSHGNLWYSFDGDNWINNSKDISHSFYTIVYIDNEYKLFGRNNNGGFFARSKDGIDFVDNYIEPYYPVTSFCYAKGIYIALTGYDSYYISSDGINFDLVSFPWPSNHYSHCGFSNGLFATGDTYNGEIITSDDGINWEIAYKFRYGINYLGCSEEISIFGNAGHVVTTTDMISFEEKELSIYNHISNFQIFKY